jgi:hypothetical protein
MSREEVRRAMSSPCESFCKGPHARHVTDAFHDSAFQVFYGGETPTVEFIELSGPSGIRAVYNGISVFETPADVVVASLSEIAPYDQDHPELGYTYIFPDLDLSLWRPVLPESPDDSDWRVFRAIGIGVKGYYGRNV